jgi:hypothetical protein
VRQRLDAPADPCPYQLHRLWSGPQERFAYGCNIETVTDERMPTWTGFGAGPGLTSGTEQASVDHIGEHERVLYHERHLIRRHSRLSASAGRALPLTFPFGHLRSAGSVPRCCALSFLQVPVPLMVSLFSRKNSLFGSAEN